MGTTSEWSARCSSIMLTLAVLVDCDMSCQYPQFRNGEHAVRSTEEVGQWSSLKWRRLTRSRTSKSKCWQTSANLKASRHLENYMRDDY